MSSFGSLLVAFLLLLLTGPSAPLSAFAALSAAGRPVVSASAEPARAVGSPIATPTDLFVDAEWLLARRDDSTVKVVALTPMEEFAAAHIPGAVAIDWPALEVTDTSDPSIERWQGEVERLLTDLGVRREQTVVVYDGGTLYAPRLWWILKQLGHEDARVLDGGLAAWRAVGGELSTGTDEGGSSRVEPYRGTPDSSALAQLGEVEAALDDPNVVLVDARSPKEYSDGHIPGAVNVEFSRNAVPEEPKVWKSEADLRAMYEAAGVTPDKRVIAYCATGVRSAATYFTLRLLGYPRVELFTGSWAEWSAHPELPTATGSTP